MASSRRKFANRVTCLEGTVGTICCIIFCYAYRLIVYYSYRLISSHPIYSAGAVVCSTACSIWAEQQTAQPLPTQDLCLKVQNVGWFTIKPSVTIVAQGRCRYSYHRCVECGKSSRIQRGLQNSERKYGCVQHPEEERQNKSTA